VTLIARMLIGFHRPGIGLPRGDVDRVPGEPFQS